jgi:PEP-CTERM motif
MKLTKFAAAAAALAAAASMISLPAHSAALAMADMAITNLRLLDANGISAAGVINILSESRTGNATSDFNGVSGTGVGPSSVSNTTIGGTADVKYRCAGDCGAGTLALYGGVPENNTGTHLGPVPTKNYSLADMVIQGGALNGTGLGLTRANAQTTGPTNSGGANATILNSVDALAQFTVGATLSAQIVIDADAWLRTWVTFPATPGNFDLASAGYGFVLTIADSTGADIITFRPGVLNRAQTSTATSALQADKTVVFNGSLASGFATFIGGETYTLTINQSSNATVQSRTNIPEPGSLALVGLALLGITAAARRRVS